ncbi:MAG: hypothetical protein ABJK28_02485 [Algibacter sp.]
MKEIIKNIAFSLLVLSFVNCDSDEDCDSNNGTFIDGECIPNYVFPTNSILEEGIVYYHKNYGIITYNNGNWTNTDATIITNDELLIE